MSTPVFDIIHNDVALIEWQCCRLVIEMSPDHFYFTVIDEKKSVVALKYYQLSYNNNQEMVNMLEEILSEDSMLKQKMATCTVIFNWPENCLVPGVYFDKSLNKEILALLHGDANRGMMLSEKINGTESYIVYSIPPVLDDFFQRHFPGCVYGHYYSLWLHNKLKDQKTIGDQVSIIFNPNEIIAAVFADRQLQVIQNFSYQTPEDIAWQVLTIYQHFNLKQEETPLHVAGMIDQNSATYEELLKYFQTVELDLMPEGISVPPTFQSFPEHFFSPLLKLAICVS